MGGWTCQVGSVGRALIFCLFVCFFIFIFIFILLVAKINPKNTQIVKKKIKTFFANKFLENSLTYFQKFSVILDFGQKNGWFYKILEK